MTSLEPRLYDDKNGGDYLSRSTSWMRNQRYADVKRIEQGLPPLAPAHIKIGRQIRYTRTALDEWADAVIAGTHPICTESPQSGSNKRAEV